MGCVRNSIIIIHDFSESKMKDIRKQALIDWANFYNIRQKEMNNMISPLLKTHVNEEFTIIINGDGSKVGWDLQKSTKQFRDKWIEEVEKRYYPQNIVIVNLGEDYKSYIEKDL